MSATTRKNFKELRNEVIADPARKERVEAERQSVIADHLEYALGELRRARGLTQFELAGVLGTPQGNVSRIENGDDILLSTLRRYVDALGGHIEINAIFSNDGERLTLRVG